METTVAALNRARIRHFVVGVGCLTLSVASAVVGSYLDERLHPRGLFPDARGGLLWNMAHDLPPTERTLSLVSWVALIALLFGLYQLWQWRGKGRRYRNQRHRAANELLRADFRRTGRL